MSAPSATEPTNSKSPAIVPSTKLGASGVVVGQQSTGNARDSVHWPLYPAPTDMETASFDRRAGCYRRGVTSRCLTAY
jgi:hypothetical protein